MKQPKLSNMIVDKKGTKAIRSMAAKTKKVKITINIDFDSLEALKERAINSGASYQKLLNQILKEGLVRKNESESRLDRLERELVKIKKKLAA
jgi:predicted DNA binding CopG/RHH family protein